MKITDSKYRAYIDEQLLKGVPTRKIAESVNTQAEKEGDTFRVSHSGISEYHKKILAGKVEKPNIEQIDPKIITALAADSVGTESMELDTETPISELLKRIFEKQVQIIDYLLSRYIQRKGRFPREEIQLLKVLRDLSPPIEKEEKF